jgi:hypothetical protein
MSNQSDRPKEGERYAPKYPRDYPASLSGLQPLPYYPNLKAALQSVTASLVFTYLEIHHPTPQDSSGTFLRVPVTLHLDKISEDLQISRRTLFTALCVLAARWRSEKERLLAARARREFLNPDHSVNGRFKPYSVTGAIGYIPHTIVQLRRNFPIISFMLRKAGISSLAQEECDGIDRFEKLASDVISAATAQDLPKTESLSEILLRASVLSVDRRKVRYPRLRAAVVAGLAPASVLKVRRNAGKDLSERECRTTRVHDELSGCAFNQASLARLRKGSLD